MSKQKTAAAPPMTGWLQDLFRFGVYKRSQGRVTRQVTFAALLLTVAIASWRMWDELRILRLPESLDWVRYAAPLVLLAGGLWLSFRVVNMARFADFLIAVEAEMNKVSWPSWPELVRSSTVVVFVIFALAFLLFAYDFVWRMVFDALGVGGGMGGG